MKTSNPLFSIILPTYNRASMLHIPIESIIAQTYKNWELIIIDDGSTDNTKEIVNSFHDDRIQYFWQENKERSAARNFGINIASGQWICFIDSDDYYLENHLEGLHSKIEAENFRKAFYFTNLSRLVDNKIEHYPSCIPTNSNDVNFLFTLNIGLIPARWCVSKEILRKHTFNEDISISEDVDLAVRIVNEFPLIHVDQHSVVYVIHDDNTTNLKNNVFQKRLEVSRNIFKSTVGEKITRQAKKDEISGCYLGISKYYLNKNNSKAIYYLIRSIIANLKNRQTKYKILVICKLAVSILLFKRNRRIVY